MHHAKFVTKREMISEEQRGLRLGGIKTRQRNVGWVNGGEGASQKDRMEGMMSIFSSCQQQEDQCFFPFIS